MATRRLEIGPLGCLPADDGVSIEPLSAYATNDFWKHPVAVFGDEGADIELHGRFVVPQEYVGAAKIVIVWTTSATSGDVEWGFAYRAVGGNDAESLDQATAQESLLSGNNDTAPSAAFERMEYEITLTAGNFAAGDTVEFILSREGADAGDTIAAAVLVSELLFEFSDA